MTTNLCSDPTLMSVMNIINNIILIVKIVLPLLLIIISILEITKVITSGNAGDFKPIVQKTGIRLISAVLVFIMPTMVSTIIEYVNNEYDVLSCFTDTTQENISAAYLRRADAAIIKAEASLSVIDYNTARFYVSQVDDAEKKQIYENRLLTVKQTQEDMAKTAAIVPVSDSSSGTASPGAALTVSGSYYSNGQVIANPGIALSSEPDPAAAINYWATKGYVSSSKFIYPKDSSTGKPLGAWPSNYSSIATQITSYKTYQGGRLIFPTTPINYSGTSGFYIFGYDHTGMDIAAKLGTPVYSPVDGTLRYSEWGHTVNKGSDETAYTVSIVMDNPFTYNNVNVNTVFLTHMSGIIYRCSENRCNRHIKKGQLVGFTGNAAGTSTSIGWAPHLHITFHNLNNYNGGLKTPKVEELFNIPYHSSNYKINVGE